MGGLAWTLCVKVSVIAVCSSGSGYGHTLITPPFPSAYIVLTCKTSDLVTPVNGMVTISPPPFGDLGEDSYINAVATFSCREGYELSENVTRTCVPNVGWDGTTPECGEYMA